MKKISIIIILLIFGLSFSVGYAKTKELPLFIKLICIDAGHGGRDPGAVVGENKEKDINLQIAKALEIELNKVGASTYMIREKDIDYTDYNASKLKRSDLNYRIKLINESGCDLFLAVHLNAANNTSWSGAQVLYEDVNKNNEVIAKLIQKQFQMKLGSRREVGRIQGLYMYKNIQIPGVLLELGFITNASDRYLLKKTEYQSKIVNAITKGVITYFYK